MKKLVTLFATMVLAASMSAQDREVLIIGAMHEVPGIVARSYAPLLKCAIKYAPDAILTEDIMPEDSLSLALYTPRFLARADSALAAAAVDEMRFREALQKPLEQMSREDFELLRDSFLRQRDRANYAFYDYLARYGTKGSRKPLRNESDDLTHRLAIAMGIRELLPIDDHHADGPYNKAKYDAIVSGAGNGDLAAYNKLLSKLDRMRIAPALTGRLGRFTNREDVLHKYYEINSLRYVQHPNDLTEEAQSLWDGRNLRMARHIADQLERVDSHRAVLVVGAGHVISLRNALEEVAPGVKVILIK